SRWELVESREPRPGRPGEPASDGTDPGGFPREFRDAALQPAERESLHALLRTGRNPGPWIDGNVVRSDDLVIPIGQAGGQGFVGLLIHRGVDFRETSPSVRAMLEALARWATLILKREGLGP